MNTEAKALRITRSLAENASTLRKSVKDGDLSESMRLMGERRELVEDLKALVEVKVSTTSSDILDEMNLLMKNIQQDVSEATNVIRAKTTTLLKELANMRKAKDIATYAALRHLPPENIYLAGPRKAVATYPVSIVNERDKT
ncbi:MAG TPA: hypothetical protein VLX91_04595 [Candidatus Acidoferrales bacterium]|nr:hypothetical protein [Candidatus Acidoferrales bacterium]